VSEYYEREQLTHVDGTRIFGNREDEQGEDAVARRLEKAWNIELYRFAPLATLDWWASKQGRLVALVELKRRSHEHGHYPTVFLSVRKWLALLLGATGLGVSPIFVVEWTDCVGWIDVRTVDASKVEIGGCHRKTKARSNIEPLITVPVSTFSEISGTGAVIPSAAVKD